MAGIEEWFVDQLNETLKVYDLVDDVDIPTNVKQAVEEGWELGVSGLAVDASLLRYSEDEKKGDRQRVVKAGDVFRILNDLENAAVAQIVQSPTSILFHFFAGLKNVIVDFAEAESLSNQIIGAYRAWQSRRILEFFAPFILRLWKQAFVALSAAQLARFITDGMKSKQNFVAAVRAKALPQRRGPRYRRRKVTRK